MVTNWSSRLNKHQIPEIPEILLKADFLRIFF